MCRDLKCKIKEGREERGGIRKNEGKKYEGNNLNSTSDNNNSIVNFSRSVNSNANSDQMDY